MKNILINSLTTGQSQNGTDNENLEHLFSNLFILATALAVEYQLGRHLRLYTEISKNLAHWLKPLMQLTPDNVSDGRYNWPKANQTADLDKPMKIDRCAFTLMVSRILCYRCRATSNVQNALGILAWLRRVAGVSSLFGSLVYCSLRAEVQVTLNFCHRSIR